MWKLENQEKTVTYMCPSKVVMISNKLFSLLHPSPTTLNSTSHLPLSSVLHGPFKCYHEAFSWFQPIVCMRRRYIYTGHITSRETFNILLISTVPWNNVILATAIWYASILTYDVSQVTCDCSCMHTHIRLVKIVYETKCHLWYNSAFIN